MTVGLSVPESLQKAKQRCSGLAVISARDRLYSRHLPGSGPEVIREYRSRQRHVAALYTTSAVRQKPSHDCCTIHRRRSAEIQEPVKSAARQNRGLGGRIPEGCSRWNDSVR